MLIASLSYANNYTILFTGDFHFGLTYQERTFTNNGQTNILETFGYDYPMQKINKFFSHADFIITNLESPITDLTQSPYSQTKEYLHREIPQKVMPIFTKAFHAVSLANNHILDYGTQGLLDTLRILDDSSIKVMGAGKNIYEAERPLYVDFNLGNKTVKLAIISAFDFRKQYATTYSFYADSEHAGTYPLNSPRLKKIIRKIKREDSDRRVIIYPHWGRDYKFKVLKQERMAKRLFKQGADLIIGHGPHLLQEIESIDDQLVVYSLGNFMFNTPGRYKTRYAHPYSLVARMDFYLDNREDIKVKLKLYPIVSQNDLTNYQARTVSRLEFRKVVNLIRKKSSSDLSRVLEEGKDELGFYLGTDLTNSFRLN